MKKINTLKSILTAAFVVGTFCVSAYAQDYDDDLYFSPSKAKKEQAAKAAAAAKAAQQQAARQQQTYQYNYTTEDFPAAGSYSVSSTRPLNIDVDTYNRRGNYSSTANASEPEMTDFANTRRIERFHNSDVVVATGDTALMEYYYSQPATQDINITIVNEVSPWSSAWNWNTPSSWWRWRYASPSWSWSFDPWFDFGWGWNWGPSWNWGWNWGPSWSWGWNWGPSWSWGWNWGPSWGWGGSGWGPGHHHPAPPVWGYNRPGANRPHAPATGNGMGSSRPHNYYDNSVSPGGYTRPGNMGRPTYGNTGNQPSGSAVRPAQNGNSQSGGTYAPSNNSQRGRNNSGTSTSTSRPQNSQSNNQNYNNSSNRNTNNNSGSWSRPGNSGRSSGGSFGGGSYGGGGGHSTGGGGGASRGRGR